MSLVTDSLNNTQTSQVKLSPGLICPFAGSLIPSRWLLCDGRTVKRSDYPDLFNVVGTSFGAGDNSTTFGLPDLRGIFVRGFDAGRGLDAGRSITSLQTDAAQRLTGYMNMTNGFNDVVASPTYWTGPFGRGPTYNATAPAKSNRTGTVYNNTFTLSKVARTAAETRPYNVAMNWIIKV